jgi:hypothetical protein
VSQHIGYCNKRVDRNHNFEYVNDQVLSRSICFTGKGCQTQRPESYYPHEIEKRINNYVEKTELIAENHTACPMEKTEREIAENANHIPKSKHSQFSIERNFQDKS